MRRGASVPLVALGLVIVLTGCGDSSVAGNETSKTGPAGAVTFVVLAESRLFAPGSELRALLWSAEQLESLRQNSRCAVSAVPATGAEEVRCPEGVQYREVIPEDFTAPVRDALVRLEFSSGRVEVGQEFRLVVSGQSSDGCNTTSATLATRAESRTVLLDELEWETTMRGCAG